MQMCLKSIKMSLIADKKAFLQKKGTYVKKDEGTISEVRNN